jgi:hypothetical protein
MDMRYEDMHADERKSGGRIFRFFYQLDDSAVLCHLCNAEMPEVVDFLLKDEGVACFFLEMTTNLRMSVPMRLSPRYITKDEPFRSLFEIFTARARPAGESCGIE